VTPLVEDELKRLGVCRRGNLAPWTSNRKVIAGAEWAQLRSGCSTWTRTRIRAGHQVLMLREGFDVNNICVIVPLRRLARRFCWSKPSDAGLRLMWRGNDSHDQKQENAQLIRAGQSRREPD